MTSDFILKELPAVCTQQYTRASFYKKAVLKDVIKWALLYIQKILPISLSQKLTGGIHSMMSEACS